MSKGSRSRADRKGKTAGKKTSAAGIEKIPAASVIKPVWDAEDRILWWDGRVVIEFGRCAPSLGLFLANFQELRWRKKVPNPFGGAHTKAHQALRNAIKKLNGRQNVLRFHGDGDGDHVRWDLIAETQPG